VGAASRLLKNGRNDSLFAPERFFSSLVFETVATPLHQLARIPTAFCATLSSNPDFQGLFLTAARVETTTHWSWS